MDVVEEQPSVAPGRQVPGRGRGRATREYKPVPGVRLTVKVLDGAVRPGEHGASRHVSARSHTAGRVRVV